MVRAPLSFQRRIVPIAAALLIASTGALRGQEEEPPLCPEEVAPYVFLLLDTSGSLNYSPPCTQTQIDNGECSFLCPTGSCFVPLQGDDPSSKLYQTKEALQTALAGEADIHFGFASFNQDAHYARAKHWVYEAQGNGPNLPGTPTPYPAAAAQEVFGYLWACDTGSGDNEIGCLPSKPADLPDAWEINRVRRLPKGGTAFNQAVTFFLRVSTPLYRVIYTPTGGGALGDATLQTTVRVDRCATSACTTFNSTVTQVVTWSRVDEFISWDNGSVARTNPEMGFFGQSFASDSLPTNTCSGWDPNTDTTSDRFNGYTLRWPTDSSDSRGTLFYVGDVIPMDWTQTHNVDIQERLAPNLYANPLATPDVRISPYLQNLPFGPETFLRLKDESKRPLIASGSTPLGNSLRSFRTWYAGCAGGTCPPTAGWQYQAALNDPDWACRRKAVIVLTDGDETCSVDPCGTVSSLRSQYNVATYAVGFGTTFMAGNKLDCMAAYGGTGSPYVPETKQELIDALNDIFAAMKAPAP